MTSSKPVTVVIGATSKWQSDGRNTHLVHGGDVDDSSVPVGIRWGVGGAISQKFAAEGQLVVLTTRHTGNAEPLAEPSYGGCLPVLPRTPGAGDTAEVQRARRSFSRACRGKGSLTSRCSQV